MAAMLFGAIPMDVIPALVRPLVGNGFAMGVIIVILLEHIILRKR
jgi:xanthine/uracil permease